MVDLTGRVAEIRRLVDAGKYFTINRARQYGKTTTLEALQRGIENDYLVLNLSFEGITHENFATEQTFVKAFCLLFKEDPQFYRMIPGDIRSQFDGYIGQRNAETTMNELFLTLGEWCAVSEKPIVLIVDEVDTATNNQVFLDFLALLRDRYDGCETLKEQDQR